MRARIDASNNQRLRSPQKLVSPCTLALLARMTNEILYQQFQVRLTPVQTLSKYYSVTELWKKIAKISWWGRMIRENIAMVPIKLSLATIWSLGSQHHPLKFVWKSKFPLKRMMGKKLTCKYDQVTNFKAFLGWGLIPKFLSRLTDYFNNYTANL